MHCYWINGSSLKSPTCGILNSPSTTVTDIENATCVKRAESFDGNSSLGSLLHSSSLQKWGSSTNDSNNSNFFSRRNRPAHQKSRGKRRRSFPAMSSYVSELISGAKSEIKTFYKQEDMYIIAYNYCTLYKQRPFL